MQKYCNCNSRLPDCCTTGWKVTHAGSRFLNSAEKSYAAIEGESLAIAWSLEQTKYFTKDCKDLVVVMDKKSLVKTFGDCALNEIQNTRITILKQRTQTWLFEVHYMPDKTNIVADAASLCPTLLSEMNSHDGDLNNESVLIASLTNKVHRSNKITCEEIVEESLMTNYFQEFLSV